MKAQNLFEIWFGQKIWLSDDRKLAKVHKEDTWMPSAKIRKNLLLTKALKDIEISDFRLKHYLSQKGIPVHELQSVTPESTSKLLRVIKGGKYLMNEITFVSGAVMEGMMELFGHEQHKAVSRYINRLYAIENEMGCYIGTIDIDGNVKPLSVIYKSKELALSRLREYKRDVQQEKKNTHAFQAEPELQIEEMEEKRI